MKNQRSDERRQALHGDAGVAEPAQTFRRGAVGETHACKVEHESPPFEACFSHYVQQRGDLVAMKCAYQFDSAYAVVTLGIDAEHVYINGNVHATTAVTRGKRASGALTAIYDMPAAP